MTAVHHDPGPELRPGTDPDLGPDRDPDPGHGPERGWWSRVGPVKRVALVVLAGVVGLNLALVALDLVIGRQPGGPTGSSLATGPDGVAGWADLLEARGVTVDRLRAPLDEADVDPATTLVLVDPGPLGTAELAAVAAHAAAGGRVVAVGASATDAVVAATGADPGWADGGPTGPGPLVDAPETAGVTRLAAEGRGTYRTPSGFTPLVGADDEVTAVRRGPVVGVADPTPLWNRHLAEADDAAFALALAGPGPVTFVESVHGYGVDEGIGALPWRWRLTAVALLPAVLLGMWSAGQRLGPPEETERDLPPPRAAYVDAVAAALSRTGRPPPPPVERASADHRRAAADRPPTPVPPGGPRDP